jgi:hypothetical protein
LAVSAACIYEFGSETSAAVPQESTSGLDFQKFARCCGERNLMPVESAIRPRFVPDSFQFLTTMISAVALWYRYGGGQAHHIAERRQQESTMTTTKLASLLERVSGWSEQDQDELAQYALEIEARRGGAYKATPAELRVLDEAVAAVRRGEVASEEEVEAVFAKHRRA